MVEQPSGTVTLVFTDIEGSTRLLQKLGRRAYRDALAAHREIVRIACARRCGYEVDCEGDAFFYVFPSAVDAIAAVEELMVNLEDGPIRVRIGVHTGEPGLDPPKYVGLDVHLAARVTACAHGGQAVVTRATRELLDAELLDLGEHRLKDITEPVRLYQLGSEKFPPLKSLNRTNLPVASSPLIGREAELAELLVLVRDRPRLVTVTGAGGTGKTRLAVQAAAELVGEFADGVFWVPLAELRNPALVLAAVTEAAAVRDPLDLRDAEALLLLDNVEHLLAAVPDLAELLVAAPKLKLLATSRAPLRIRGEHEYPLDPLREEEAVAFFAERAREVGTIVEPDAIIDEICRRLDRLPLALELAAARLRALDPPMLLERLEPRLPLLTLGSRDAPERQRTLRTTIEWSYELLDEPSRELFAQLSVFAGSFALETAEAICGANLDGLESLVDLSLLKPVGGTRFLMLETIREYARDRLAQTEKAPDVHRRHASWCAALVEEAEPQLAHGGEQVRWLERLDAEQAEIRGALLWALDAAPAEASRIAAAAWRYWFIRGRLVEATVWYDAALARETEPIRRMPLLAGKAAASIGVRDGEAARAACAERLELARRLDDREHIYGALNHLGVEALSEHEYEESAALFASAVEAAPDEGSWATAISNRGLSLGWLGDYAQARVCLSQGLQAADRLGNELLLISNRRQLAQIELTAGRVDEALRAGRAALERAHRLEFSGELAYALDVVAAAIAAQGDAERAARIQGMTDELLTRAKTRYWTTDPKDTYYVGRRRAREALVDKTYDSLHAQGAALTVDDAVALALEK